jgi:hypothetical protein
VKKIKIIKKYFWVPALAQWHCSCPRNIISSHRIPPMCKVGKGTHVNQYCMQCKLELEWFFLSV